jgi:DNA polymerase III gamma/tau subunit
MTNPERHHELTGFGGIVGQKVPTSTLTHLVNTRHLPGTLLFCGPGGTGKLATALALAKILHCKGSDKNICGCDSCAAIRVGNHPDVIVLSRDKLYSVEEMREIVALTGLRSAPGQERVIIIDRAESLFSSPIPRQCFFPRCGHDRINSDSAFSRTSRWLNTPG